MISEKLDFPESFDGLEKMIQYLTGPDGCPWDKKQTPTTLTPMLVEECYELVDAIENNNHENIIEEIGDVIFHLAFQIRLGNLAGLFNSKDIFISYVSVIFILINLL